MSDRHVDQLPSPGLKRALTLVRNLEELQRATTTLLDRVESVTTLRAGEVWVLTALASAPARLDALARHIGQPPDVTTTLVAGLTRRGLLDQTPGPDSPLLALTDDGTATLTQITGMQIRLLDHLTTALGPEGTQALDLVVRNLPAALRDHPETCLTRRVAGPTPHRGAGSVIRGRPGADDEPGAARGPWSHSSSW